MELVDTAGWVGQTKTRLYDNVGGAVADMARKQVGVLKHLVTPIPLSP